MRYLHGMKCWCGKPAAGFNVWGPFCYDPTHYSPPVEKRCQVIEKEGMIMTIIPIQNENQKESVGENDSLH